MDENLTIKLEIFEGPLDLLLYLVKKNEVDIYDIPVALILEQFLEYLEIMKELNLDIAGEFFIMSSTLAEIKSKMLLQMQSDEEAMEDPRAELVQQLLEYQKYKELGEKLERLQEEQLRLWTRIASDISEFKEEEVLIEANLYDLLMVFKEFLKKCKDEVLLEIDKNRLSIKEKMNWVMEMLQSKKFIRFSTLMNSISNRKEMIVAFLAILELAKMQAIKIFQARNFGIILLKILE